MGEGVSELLRVLYIMRLKPSHTYPNRRRIHLSNVGDVIRLRTLEANLAKYLAGVIREAFVLVHNTYECLHIPM